MLRNECSGKCSNVEGDEKPNGDGQGIATGNETVEEFAKMPCFTSNMIPCGSPVKSMKSAAHEGGVELVNINGVFAKSGDYLPLDAKDATKVEITEETTSERHNDECNNVPKENPNEVKETATTERQGNVFTSDCSLSVEDEGEPVNVNTERNSASEEHNNRCKGPPQKVNKDDSEKFDIESRIATQNRTATFEKDHKSFDKAFVLMSDEKPSKNKEDSSVRYFSTSARNFKVSLPNVNRESDSIQELVKALEIDENRLFEQKKDRGLPGVYNKESNFYVHIPQVPSSPLLRPQSVSGEDQILLPPSELTITSVSVYPLKARKLGEHTHQKGQRWYQRLWFQDRRRSTNGE